MGADATGSQPQFLAIFLNKRRKSCVFALWVCWLWGQTCLELGWLDGVLAAQWPSELAVSLAAQCDCLK